MNTEQPLLAVHSLSVSFPRRGQRVRILDHAAFEVARNEIVGMVGESGSGKTLSSLTIMGFLPRAARVDSGEICLNGIDLLRLPADELSRVRGRQIAMIFQSVRSALNPMMRVGEQVTRAVRLQQKAGNEDAERETRRLLSRVGIPDVERVARAYPHQLSGGMCQRVLIAMMLACRPALLIADEPTTGLDVTIQAQIFELIREVQQETKASILLITHDLGVVAETCERVIVMYGGQIMESAPIDDLFERPAHPYTRLLMRSVLRVDKKIRPPERLMVQSEEVTYGILGCRFAPRCGSVLPHCWEQRPALELVSTGHLVYCHNWRGMDGSTTQS